MNFITYTNNEKQIQKISKSANNLKNEYSKSNQNQFNSFKYKHFNNFFCNILNEQIKQKYVNKNINQNENNDDVYKNNTIIKNEFIHETLSKKRPSRIYLKNDNRTVLNHYDIKHNNIFLKPQKKSYISHTRNSGTLTNFKNKKKTLPNINIKSINNNKDQKSISNFISDQFKKTKNKMNSRNMSFIEKENNQIENSKKILKGNISNFLYKTSDFNYMNTNRTQQLPKDAVKGLLIFLKNNKKYLAKTSKYYNIYKKYKHFINDNPDNSIMSKNKDNKKYNDKNINIGYYGRKPLDGIKYYETTSTYKNQYSNKSEKNRHEIILDELNKLKGYIDKNKKEKDLFIKDFLNRHYIDCNDQAQLNAFENFINNLNKNQIYNLLKPYLGIKEMLLDILKEGEKINSNINTNTKSEEINKKNNNCSSNDKIQQNNNILINQIESNIYKSPYIIKQNYLYSKKNNNNKKALLKVLNFNSEKINRIKTLNIGDKNNLKSFDLLSTNSYLKKIEKQKKLYYPNKDYSSNYNLIVDEIGEELKELNNNIKEEKKFKISEYFIKKNKNRKNKKNIILNLNFSSKTPNKSIENVFITSNKTFINNDKILNENNYDDEVNKNLNKIKKKKMNRNNKMNFSSDRNKFQRSNKKKITDIIINKLNLKPDKIEIDDIRKKLKLTEYIVFNHAKKKLAFDKLRKKELFECVNSAKKNKK